MIIINDNKKLIKYSKTFKNKKNKLKIHNVSQKKKSSGLSSNITKNKKGGNIKKKYSRMDNTNNSIKIIPASSLF